MSKFSEERLNFERLYKKSKIIKKSFVTVNGKIKDNIVIRNSSGSENEEYYKWQFIFSLIYSGLYPKDYVGVEVSFPKGNKSSASLRLDAAIFDDPAWINYYTNYWKNKKGEDLEWLNNHLLAAIEFKKNEKQISQIFTGQIKSAMREKEPSTSYVLGIYYDSKSMYLFHRVNGRYIRYDESKNLKGEESKLGDLSLHLPDPYYFIPSFSELKNKVNKPKAVCIADRTIYDLDIITSIITIQLQEALSKVLRGLDRVGLVNQRGYEILIQTLALKIFDEKRNEKTSIQKLKFYILPEEKNFNDLRDKAIQNFIERMKAIWSEAEEQYQKILGNKVIDWKNQNHVSATVAICEAFQDFSFISSSKNDLYQLVFYNFANAFKRDESAQFLTPLPVIDFIVQLVNPRSNETIFDPCCGIGDFLSLSYVNSQSKSDPWKLDDANIYGVDLDENMIMLATLNMLLNGDGEAKLFQKPDKGSILSKVAQGSPPYLVDLITDKHANGNWDVWPDNTKLKKFDVILTNPPFGEDRSYRPQNDFDRKVIEMYELWNICGEGDSIDLGIVFLENAYQCLKEEGRLGIVLSNSIASINKWRKVREWLIDKMRIVALFDLPPNVFAETGVNTSIIIAYKPKQSELTKLNKLGYSVFVRDIGSVGYEKRTSKRNVFFNPVYKIDETTFNLLTDDEGNPVRDEDFSNTIIDFKKWALGQEDMLQKLFLREE